MPRNIPPLNLLLEDLGANPRQVVHAFSVSEKPSKFRF